MTRNDQDGDLAGTIAVDNLDQLHLSAARARRRLLEAPGLISWVRLQITPTMGGAQDGMPRAASKTAPLPLRADAVDDSDDAFARLLEWVSYWAGELDADPPVAIRAKWATPDDPRGFRAGTTPDGAGLLVQTATTWLLTRQDRIELNDSAAAYFDDVADITFQLRQRYPRAPRPARGVLERPCPVCDRFSYGAEWVEGGGVEDFALSCSHCGHTETAVSFIKAGRVRELLHELREEHADPRSEWWTKRKAVLELDIRIQTLNRYITEDDLPTYTVDGVVYVNTEELLALYRRKRMTKKGFNATPKSA